MIKCTPIVTAITSNKITFNVIIVDADTSIDNIHTMNGGGTGYSGKKVGEASVILQDCSETFKYADPSVLYIDGYRDDGKNFNVGTEATIITACKNAAKQIWER